MARNANHSRPLSSLSGIRVPPGQVLAHLLLALLPGVLPLAAGPATPAFPNPARSAALHSAATGAVQSALADPRPGQPRLLGSSLAGNRLTLDFSRELLALDPGSAAFAAFSRRVHRAAAAELAADFSDLLLDTRIEGIPLDRLLPTKPAPTPPRAAQLPTPATPPVTAALAGRRLAVSPGHGYYLNPTGTWVLQRGYWQGLVEDFVNHDMVTLLRDELAGAGAAVLSTRNLDRAAGNGESGFPRWQEAARYHVKALGADASVWNEPGYTHLDQDIRCRPRWANAVNADLLVSLHNNGGGGTGTETLYDTSNGFGAESKRLADAVHARVITTLRRDYLPGWTDRRVQGFNGSYGENRLATRPSILIEVAFMDRPVPDNAALQDEAFRRLVARAIREGIEDFLDGPASAPPSAPASLLATTSATSTTLTWSDTSSNESGFRIERRSSSAATWDTLGSVAADVTSFTDPAPPSGTPFAYRVAAFNAAGSSTTFSNEATIIPPPALAPGPRSDAWLANVSLRTTLAGGQVVTVGLVVADGSRQVLLRAAGPALTAFGLTSALADPRLDLFRGSSRLADNNDWPAALGPIMAAVGAFPFPTASRDAALLQSIDGAVTVQAGGATAGTVLIEGYDGGGTSGRIVNLSARQRVGTGADLLIAGFQVSGSGTKRLLLRAAGPALLPLGVTGVLDDPKLEVFTDSGTRLAENDQWPEALAETFRSVGAFAWTPGSRDAALVLTVPAGRSYTAQVSGATGGTGEALVEIYELP